jgi:hypothetical protein
MKSVCSDDFSRVTVEAVTTNHLHRRNFMTTYEEVTQALVSAGYLSEADIDAALVVLADRLIVADAEETKAFAVADIAYQEEVIVKTGDLVDMDYEMGEIEDRFVQEAVIDSAAALADKDEAMIEEAEATIVAAYEDAAAALLAAELIDEANLEAVTGVITDVLVTAEGDYER